MDLESSLESDNFAEYLRKNGFEVIERDNTLIEIVGGSDEFFGRTIHRSIVIDPDDVLELLDAWESDNTPPEEVFDEYIIEKKFTAEENSLSNEEREELREHHREEYGTTFE